MFIDALPYEGNLFHVDEPTNYSESLTASPEMILSPAFRHRFRHLKRLTFQQKTCGSFVLERDVNCFEQLEHLELRVYEINDGGRLRLKKLKVLLIETQKAARYVVDCEQLTAFHFSGRQPAIVYPNSLRHASFDNLEHDTSSLNFKKDALVKLCRRCPNLTRLTITSDAINTSTLMPNGCRSSMLSVSCFIWIVGSDTLRGLIQQGLLGCLERIDLDLRIYIPYSFSRFRYGLRWLRSGSPSLHPLQGSHAEKVFQKLSVHFGSQDLVNDNNFDELYKTIMDMKQFKKSRHKPGLMGLSLNLLHYSDLVTFQRPMEGLIDGLQFLLVDRKVNLARDPLINQLANLRELRIQKNQLDETVLNQFTRQFKFLAILLLDRCKIKSKIRAPNIDLLPNYSVHFLLIERCTCSNPHFIASFKNAKRLYLLDTELGVRFSFILRSLKYLTTFCHSTLGAFIHSGDEFVLSAKKASSIAEMIEHSRECSSSNCFRFTNLDFS